MKLVLTKPIDSTSGKLYACYVNGIYHQFKYICKKMPKQWRTALKNLKRSVVKTDFEIEEIKKNGYARRPGDEKHKLAKLALLQTRHQKDIKDLEKLLANIKNPDPYIEHAMKMFSNGIISDDWNGDGS